MGKFKKTRGGVTNHAVERVKLQYDSKLDKKEIKKVLRESKLREEKINRFTNGQFMFTENEVARLCMKKFPRNSILVAIVAEGEIRTVEDKLLHA